MNRIYKSHNGFTLIEIMVVVAVIALLGAMIGPTLFNKVQQAEETRVAQDIRAIESALRFYRLDNYRYPTQGQGLNALINTPADAEDRWNGPYLESMPLDPWGQTYLYAYPSTNGRDFDVYTLGADQQENGEGTDQDWGNWNIQ
ncbi:MAG: type II secretion system major pseudopilin GspG [Gammaproteobacteria bacterium]|jgi:general secretion pathway protein G|nr:type II secretion system major pseudopilin GspG [Gammaproteobacteria bacterium]